MNRRQWRILLKWFMLEQSVDMISLQTGIRRERVMRALLVTREVMKTDLPSQLSGIVEVDETYWVVEAETKEGV